MTVLVTGAAGFIGFHVASALLARGEAVLGIDNLNAYYDPALKQARLDQLTARPGFRFERIDFADRAAMLALAETAGRDVTGVVHLGAQAGVRHSLTAPFDYVHSNLIGHMVILEACRSALPEFRHLVYASTSSVYGGNTKVPFSVEDRVDRPVSLYAATKRADELMTHSYSHLFGLKATGLRFFTVYGPWGRPDMAAYLFADAIMDGRPVQLFNEGRMRRDFTYIDDIVAGVLAALDRPPEASGGEAPHRLYNLGNNRSEELGRFLEVLEDALGFKAKVELRPMQPGDVEATYADIEASTRDLGYRPTTPIDVGLPRFVEWYKGYRQRAGAGRPEKD
ncbi:SDR family NAD(P)-dependent oxidoreductase [Marinivivus vitaminiproducens]|uniref:SDR family NAD(P)-dependent oxidoreductase n=1 Tax=Marinivivus vitaminiproducens TaxID=3035935 RepID=UPI00279B29AE|nr:SDR family NAD(P)-dependent oxidoreductase [Geminicoccaceae bacterium SCSIO 64248]